MYYEWDVTRARRARVFKGCLVCLFGIGFVAVPVWAAVYLAVTG